MNVVDSSCWLEFIEDSSIGNEVAPIIADVEHLLVPSRAVRSIQKIERNERVGLCERI